MRKARRDAVLESLNQTKINMWHQIDLYGALIGVFLFWTTILVVASINSHLIEAVIPTEVLIHSPVTINASIAFGMKNRMICNPHFNTFLNNATYFTDDFKQVKLRKAVSEEFLKRPDVSNVLKEYSNRTGLDTIIMAFGADRLCELSFPSKEVGDCMNYKEIQETCLEKGCDVGGVNLCWWWTYRTLRTFVLAVAALHFLGTAQNGFVICNTILWARQVKSKLDQVVLLLFDPPPRGLEKITKLWLCSLFFLLVGLVGLIQLPLVVYSKTRYFLQPAISEAFPKYSHVLGANLYSTLFFVLSDLAFGVIYFYLQVYTPKYPRLSSRWKRRRNRVEKRLKKLEIQVWRKI